MGLFNHSLRALAGLTLLFLILVSLGCGAKRVGTGEPPDVLYAKVNEELAKEGGFPYFLNSADYDSIFNMLKEIRVRHPYSPYTPLAELKTGDAYFKKGEYAQAVVEYEEFLTRRPMHPDVSYATYRLGLSHFERRKSIDRDPTSIREANRWFVQYLSTYPDDEYTQDAAKMYIKTRSLLAKREIYIGNFYFKKKSYKAAAGRYQEVIDAYPDTNRLEEALYKLGEARFRGGELTDALEPLRRVVNEYPGGDYSGKASGLLREIEAKI